VDWVTTVNPLLADLHPFGLASRAAHPNAGKLFIDFVLSRQGQELAVAAGSHLPQDRSKTSLSATGHAGDSTSSRRSRAWLMNTTASATTTEKFSA
jgi:ABC-type Fe3+ transport system substrate-binding protein